MRFVLYVICSRGRIALRRPLILPLGFVVIVGPFYQELRANVCMLYLTIQRLRRWGYFRIATLLLRPTQRHFQLRNVVGSKCEKNNDRGRVHVHLNIDREKPSSKAMQYDNQLIYLVA